MLALLYKAVASVLSLHLTPIVELDGVNIRQSYCLL